VWYNARMTSPATTPIADQLEALRKYAHAEGWDEAVAVLYAIDDLLAIGRLRSVPRRPSYTDLLDDMLPHVQTGTYRGSAIRMIRDQYKAENFGHVRLIPALQAYNEVATRLGKPIGHSFRPFDGDRNDPAAIFQGGR